MWHAWVRWRMHTGIWWRNVKHREHLDLVVGGRIILGCVSREYDGRACTGLIWVGTQTSGGLS